MILLLGALCGCEVAARVLAEREVGLPLSSGRTLKARIQVPASLTPLPAVMLFGGLERGAAALDLVEPARPTVLASFDYPVALPDEVSVLELLRLLPAARRGIRDSLEGMGRLHAQLQAMPEVDPARISIVGVSLGAPFAVVAAADHRIPGLAVIHGFGDVPEVIAHQLLLRQGAEPDGWLRPLADALAWFLSFAASVPNVEERAARLHAGQRVLVLGPVNAMSIAAAEVVLAQRKERTTRCTGCT